MRAGGGVVVEFRGLQEWGRQFSKLTGNAKKALRNGLRAGAKITTAAARAVAPVRTGQLRRAIRTKAAKRSRRYIGVKTMIGEGYFKGETFYGAFVEFGWKTGKRHPSLTAIAKQIASRLRAESRALRVASKGLSGLAKFGSKFRQRQEAYFAREAARQVSVLPDPNTGRRQIPGQHFMEQSANRVASHAGNVAVKETITQFEILERG